MSTTAIVVVVIGVAMALFFIWAWAMNRLDERREWREREATRRYWRGLP